MFIDMYGYISERLQMGLLPNRMNLDFLQFNVSKFWSSHWEIKLRSLFMYFSMSLADLDE
jgi:hypothetical protein